MLRTTSEDPRVYAKHEGLVIGTYYEKSPSWVFVREGGDAAYSITEDDRFFDAPRWVDVGIGPYEFWGDTGVDVHWTIEGGTGSFRVQCILKEDDCLESIVDDVLSHPAGDVFPDHWWMFSVEDEERTPIDVDGHAHVLASATVSGELCLVRRR
jgi:hypothetical protein